MTDTSHASPASHVVFVPPGAGRRVWVTDELITFVVSGEQTGGAYSLTDSTVPPGGGPPPHSHSREDEAFWIVEGELEVRVGEQTFRAGPGAFVQLPRGIPHSYQNVGPGPARFLTLMVPAGLERFFAEVGTAASAAGGDSAELTPPPFGDAELEALLEAAPRYGVHISLPPEG